MSKSNYSDEFLSVLIPDDFEVISGGAQFFASTKDITCTLTIEIEDDIEFEEENREFMKESLGVNPDLESRIVRSGEAIKGKSAFEKIIEHQVIATGDFSHIWSIVFSNEAGKVALVDMTGKGKFEDFEPTWIKVLDTIELKS